MKKTYMLTVRGTKHKWGFRVKIDEKFLEDYRQDDLEIEKLVMWMPERWPLPTWVWAWIYDMFISED